MTPWVHSASIDRGLFKAMLSERGILAMIIASQAVAFIYTLSSGKDFWLSLGLVSLFTHANAFITLALIAFVVKYFKQLSFKTELGIVLVFFQSVCIFTSLIVQYTTFSPVEPIDWQFVFNNNAICGFVVILLLHFMAIYIDNLNTIAHAANAELEALQARIRPHFLHNALNTLAELCHENPNAAEEAALTMAKLMQVAFASGKKHSLSQEISLTKGYLTIEKYRFEHRLNVEWSVQNVDLDVRVPALILQPLVENAVVHGIEPARLGGSIKIKVNCREDKLLFTVDNPFNPESKSRSGQGIALENIRRRLVIYYGEQAALKTSQKSGRFFINVVLPLGALNEISGSRR
ncbi:sensor histidine kinase [Pseudoalteromonas luteoviolacea]|uniref:sensor histidine kinase n=1 Tax=Pseudoalteromonas luteoviolacea TaxID=43657 RepID=UPI001B383D51|nr:histidine kinase [Pseudoalteromonas luteoviolacea]MBQ4836192.1 histidine kinase [Pseudoalteromonas luteoviolacea]